jgi:hypothetical protein
MMIMMTTVTMMKMMWRKTMIEMKGARECLTSRAEIMAKQSHIALQSCNVGNNVACLMFAMQSVMFFMLHFLYMYLILLMLKNN